MVATLRFNNGGLGGGGASDLATVLGVGNATGGTDLVVSSGDHVAGVDSATPGEATFRGGDATGGGASGAAAFLRGGASDGVALGGQVNMVGGFGGPGGGVGGSCVVTGGTGLGGGAGGQTSVSGGAGLTGIGGNLILAGGIAGTGAGGDARVNGGAGSGGPDGDVDIGLTNTTNVNVAAAGNALGFHGAAAVAQQTITGAKGGNAALTDLLTKLATLGLVVDSTT
jgi:hypothetical protein